MLEDEEDGLAGQDDPLVRPRDPLQALIRRWSVTVTPNNANNASGYNSENSVAGPETDKNRLLRVTRGQLLSVTSPTPWPRVAENV
jgi:hypothetical protein